MLKRWFVVAVGAVGAVACSDALEENTTVGQFIAAASSGTTSLTLISATDFSARALALPTAGAVSVAGRGSVLALAVNSPSSGALVIGDLAQRLDAPIRVIPLDTTGTLSAVTIASDSVAWVADPGEARLWRVNYRTGDTANAGAALVPGAGVVATAGKIFAPVVTAPSTGYTQALVVLDAATGAVQDSIFLSIGAFRYATVGGDSLIYVVADNRLSIVDPITERELVVINDIGPAPGIPVFHPSGRLLIPTGGAGIVEVNTLTRSVSRGPDEGPNQGIKPQGDSVIVALALDQGGRVYALDAAAGAAGMVRILSAPPDYGVLRTIALGGGPVGAAVAALH